MPLCNPLTSDPISMILLREGKGFQSLSSDHRLADINSSVPNFVSVTKSLTKSILIQSRLSIFVSTFCLAYS